MDSAYEKAASKLNADQRRGFELLCHGDNLFLSGEAGTGKSFLINQYLRYLDESGKSVTVCAPSGIAASLLDGGSTIHKAFSLKGEEFFRPGKERKISQKILNSDVIIVDEVSMCRCDLLDTIIDIIDRAKKERPSVRHQLILVGDPFQLPPVVKNAARPLLRSAYPSATEGYFFESHSWDDDRFKICFLKEPVRQKDNELSENLNRLREGDPSCIGYFNRFVSKRPADGAGVFLTGMNVDVDEVNLKKTDELEGELFEYSGVDKGGYPKDAFPFPDTLRLKKGARVMALINDSQGRYVNGSLGTVTSLTSNSVTVLFDKGNEVTLTPHTWKLWERKPKGDKVRRVKGPSYTRIPLREAYALTIHKSQGQTFDSVVINPHAFAAGQLYVALSRCKTPEGLVLTQPIRPEDIMVSEAVQNWYEHMLELEARQGGQIACEDALRQTSGDAALREKYPVLASNSASAVWFKQVDSAIGTHLPHLQRFVTKGYVGYRTHPDYYDITVTADEDWLRISLYEQPDPDADAFKIFQPTKRKRYNYTVHSEGDLRKALDVLAKMQKPQ